MNPEKAIRSAVDTGKVLLGERETLRALKNKEAKLVIYAANCSEGIKESLKRNAKLAGVPSYEFHGTSLELGAVCGKPFLVSALCVLEPGESGIFELGRK